MQRFIDKPIDEFVKAVEDLNARNSSIFCGEQLSRRLYRSEHPTEIAAFKCMDGRIHLPLLTRTPIGIIQPFRNLAGRFDLGWPYLGELFLQWVDYAISKKRKCLVLVTYHFSKGDTHRGCAGFNYCKEDAFNFSLNFRKQIERMTRDRNVVYPIIVGLETDTDVLIFHGLDHNKTLNVGELDNLTEEKVSDLLEDLYPDMPERILLDLIPLILGNAKHIKEEEIINREILDSQHRERIVGIGRGFDWLHEPNLALIIGPYSPNLSEPIKTAASIIKDNMTLKRIPDDGFMLMTSAPYREVGLDKDRAIEKARFLLEFSKKVLSEYDEEFAKKMKPIGVIVDTHTRHFEKVA